MTENNLCHSYNQRVEDLIVYENRIINDFYYVLKLFSPQGLPEINPGNFVNVLVEESSSTFLRRPISIYQVDIASNTLDLLIQIVGAGTKKLSEKKKGDIVNLIYPLGQAYNFNSEVKSALLIGGGVGIAPLLFLAKVLKDNAINVETLFGGRSQKNIIEVEKFQKYGKVHISTEDGSLGEKGFLTLNSVISEIKRFDKIYVCGPDPMMKSVARIAKSNAIECEVSLENLMACGIGACLCCIEDTTTGNRCACTDGPVFNINELKWN